MLETATHGRWDVAAGRLADLGSTTYDEASVADFTLRRVAGVWKVVNVHYTRTSFNRENGIHPDSA